MTNMMSKDQIEDLLVYLGSSKLTQWKGDKIQACCPIHGESNPSFGINVDFSPPDKPQEHYQVFNCLSCHAHGTIPWLVHQSLPDQFKTVKDAIQWLKDKYGVEYAYHYDPKTKTLKRYEEFYEEVVEKRFTVPMSKLAPLKSGKQTFQYFFDRGFDKEDMKEYMIGRDLANETVTIPVFWEDGELAGIIGRYIDPSRPKNKRYRIYEFPKSELLYPLDKLEVSDDTLILVEGQFDAMMLRKWGYFNVLATFTNAISRHQVDLIVSKCSKVITLFDYDEGGDIARENTDRVLGSKINVFHPTWYPRKGKDPAEWGEKNTVKVIKSAEWSRRKTIPRYD